MLKWNAKQKVISKGQYEHCTAYRTYIVTGPRGDKKNFGK